MSYDYKSNKIIKAVSEAFKQFKLENSHSIILWLADDFLLNLEKLNA